MNRCNPGYTGDKNRGIGYVSVARQSRFRSARLIRITLKGNPIALVARDWVFPVTRVIARQSPDPQLNIYLLEEKGTVR